MAKIRIVHYLNQFFAGKGGEDKADIGFSVQPGAVGPGRALLAIAGEGGEIIATLVCGDNYINDRWPEARAAILAELEKLKPDLVIAGPAFNAGRYSLACVSVCKLAPEAGIAAITAMYPESPGAAMRGHDLVVVATGPNPAGMADALKKMWQLGSRLARKEELGPARDEGYLPRGIRKSILRSDTGYKRAVDMLSAKVHSRPFSSEIPVYLPDRVPVMTLAKDLKDSIIALVTTGGLVRRGNPDSQVASNTNHYQKHFIGDSTALTSDDWEAYHAGYFNDIASRNPNYILPLSHTRKFQQDGVIRGVHTWIYTLPGCSTPIDPSRRLGRDIARELKESGVDGCLLVST